jgi:response regulator RpfG family c-di-GMP phosphodiesterase
MSNSGEIIIVEDDIDDQEILETTIRSLNYKNDLVWFESTSTAFEYLSTTKNHIFIILSDINLPGKNGLEFKRNIDNDPVLRKKSIPFIFFSTLANQKDVNIAYTEMVVQGFFKKPYNFEEIKTVIKTLLDYWSLCKHPNTQ